MGNQGIRGAILAAAFVPAAALAQTAGAVTTDLNLREGPGSNYAVITTIPEGEDVVINGCVEGAPWCEVSYGSATGYSYAQYLVVPGRAGTVVVEQERGLVPSIAANTIDAVGNTAGAITGALIGGTVGAVTGGFEGAGEGARSGAVAGSQTFDVSDDQVVYVRQNPREPVYLEGEAVVGAGVPAEVTLYEVPQSEYRYVNINGTPVLVEPSSRRIVHVVR
ncbi:DUF1236 domain-containing protein [Acuticoccus sp.]|uniref:DUF1236 domain-containing protein n=1 Tax=Acuticoccus sp. TaxID=1904378 RepID=UPI003B518255